MVFVEDWIVRILEDNQSCAGDILKGDATQKEQRKTLGNTVKEVMSVADIIHSL